ncbi:MAG: DNA gyrase inhibitor YacG [Holosporales bacterium]|jgi:endogenous inhibitor of DNA gyrase (YacG/DUF329 family)|nr:DNA gyrase inhibitor YacG [Holosporales bacterium]
MQCPICGKKTQDNMSFCSKTCQLIDLSRWFRGSYRIPTDERPEPTEERSAALPPQTSQKEEP